MDSTNTAVLIAMILYIIVLLTVGVVYARRANTNSKEYFLGGRKLGPWVTALSAEASDMSGWLLMGLPGVAYFCGASEAGWTAIGLAIGTYLSWRFVAKRLRKYSHVANDSITLPDYFSNRVHDQKMILASIAAVVILLFFSIYVGSCFVTCGKLFASIFGLNYTTMMIVGAIIVFVYTLIGGFLAESTSDFIQGTLMFVALIVVFCGTFISMGGWDTIVGYIGTIPGFLSLTSQAVPTEAIVDGFFVFDAPTKYSFLSIISTLAWGLGYFGMPQVLLRFMAIRSSKEIKKSRRVAVSWCVISLACAVGIGLIGRAAFPTMFDTGSASEAIFIQMALDLLPAFIAGIILSGILAASMSSADSYMLIAASALSINIFKNIFKKDASEKVIMWVSRGAMCLLLVFGILIALDENSSIFGIVSYAWAGFGAAFGPLMLASLYWRRLNFAGSLAGMIGGAGTVLIWKELLNPLGGVFGIYELLPGFIVGLLCLIVVSLLTKPPSAEITQEFDTYQTAEV